MQVHFCYTCISSICIDIIYKCGALSAFRSFGSLGDKYLLCICFIATSDYGSRSGEITINEDDTYQCLSIPIYTDSTTESLQCFSFQITLSNTVNNLTVDPDEASICIVDVNGKDYASSITSFCIN